jgi:hypothetical protein
VAVVTITMVYAPMRDECSILRVLDGERRRLAILCQFGQGPAEVYAAVADQLTTDEQAEVRLALGLDQPGGAA